jgi:hypothetical protein
MRYALVLVVALIASAFSVAAHTEDGPGCFSCEKMCRGMQHKMQDKCVWEFDKDVRECKEDFRCGTAVYRECKQEAYDEKQPCMDATDVFYDSCVDRCESR